MTRNPFCAVKIFDTWYSLNGSEASDATNSSGGQSEEIAEDPVCAVVAIEKPAAAH